MSRPLIQKRVDELEAMFATGQEDFDTLRLLEAELSHRSVPRAASLLVKVRLVLRGGSITPSVTQNELFEHRPQAIVQAPLWSSATVTEAQAPQPLSQTRPAVTVSEPTPLMSYEEACKILRVAVGATWETIEQARRQIVDRAHPAKIRLLADGQRDKLVFEAKRANDAYAVLRARSAS